MIRFKFLLRTSLIAATEALFTDLEGSLDLHLSHFHSTVQNIIVSIGISQKQCDYFTQLLFLSLFFFSIRVFFHEHSRITGLQGKGEGISLTPHYHFHPLHGHLDFIQSITAESSPLHIASSRTRNGNLWFPSASQKIYIIRRSTLCAFQG